MSSMNTYKHPEYQYLALMRDILENGIKQENPRTGSNTLTVLNRQIKFDGNVFPLITVSIPLEQGSVFRQIRHVISTRK